MLKIPPNLNLHDDERRVWRHVARHLGEQLISSDAYVLEAFCRHFCRWRRLCAAEQTAVREGKDYEAGRLGRSLSAAWKGVESSMAKLGLSPKDRKRITGGSGTPGLVAKENPLLKMLKDRN